MCFSALHCMPLIIPNMVIFSGPSLMSSSPHIPMFVRRQDNQSVCRLPGQQMARPCLLGSLTTSCVFGPSPHRCSCTLWFSYVVTTICMKIEKLSTSTRYGWEIVNNNIVKISTKGSLIILSCTFIIKA